MTPVLEATGLGMTGRLQPTDLQLAPGSLTAVIGPNGGGKTSLLRSIARIDDPQGVVTIEGANVDHASAARRLHMLAFLPAARDVPWPIAARDVIALGLPAPDPQRVDALLDLLDLRPLAARPIDRLSTGERTRVLLGRALAAKPRVLLLDEPLSNLDPYWALRIMDVLTEIARAGPTLLVSLHDLHMLDRFDRTLVVANGAIVADTTPGEMLSAAVFGDVFGVERDGSGWRIRQS